MVFFENVFCETCGDTLGCIPENMEMGSFIISKVGKLEQHSKNQNDSIPNWKPCTNYTGNGVYNWMLPADDPSDLCWSCRLSLKLRKPRPVGVERFGCAYEFFRCCSFILS